MPSVERGKSGGAAPYNKDGVRSARIQLEELTGWPSGGTVQVAGNKTRWDWRAGVTDPELSALE